MDTVTIQ